MACVWWANVLTQAWMVWKMSACDFISKCLWVASFLDLGICV